MRALSFALAALACACVSGDADARIGSRTLVVLGKKSLRKSHSQFFTDLKEDGHQLSFAKASDSTVELKKYGEYLFDNLVVMAPAVEDFASFEPSDVLDFVDNGGHAMIALDSDTSETMRELVEACGIDVDAPGSAVIDHVQHVASSDDHRTVYSAAYLASEPVLGAVGAAPAQAAPVLFRGVGMAVADDNFLALRILSGGDTSYSAAPDQPVGEYPQSAGRDVLLAAAVQARNNARVTVVGSLAMLGNKMFSTAVTGADGSAWPQSGNRAFARELATWAFGRRGMLRVRDVAHSRADGRSPETQLGHIERPDLPSSLYPDPEVARDTLVYRIKDELEFKMRVEEWRGGEWAPFAADDVQLEFVMLDPYVRTRMAHDGAGLFSARFLVPDVYGIFKFRVMYRRPGLATLHTETQVSIRPFRHNEYERFIVSAYPYYGAAFAMMGSFFVFGFSFLYTKDAVKVKEE